jgi:Cu-Zn family superoxide dismutase
MLNIVMGKYNQHILLRANEEINMVLQMLKIAVGVSALAALAGCTMYHTGKLPTELKAKADLAGQGIKGEASLEQEYEGRVRIKMKVKGDPGSKLTPGLHAVHIHAVGDCTPPFTAAGGHYDGNIVPGENDQGANVTPGLENHPYHLGDLQNLETDADGNGTLYTITSRVTLSPGLTTVFDQDGSAFIIHELPDLYKAQPPVQNAPGGPRIACGVIVKAP